MMIAGLDEQDLVHLSFSKVESAQLDWKHSTEFAFEGELYDVVRVYEQGDQITYICWHDHEETALSRDLDQLLVNYFNQAPESNRTKARTVLFLKTLIAIETGIGMPRLHASNRQVENLKPYLQRHYSVHLGTHTPPPRLV